MAISIIDGMTYDVEENRLILKSSYVKEKLNIVLDTALGSEDETLVFLDELSEVTDEVGKTNVYNNSCRKEFSHESWYIYKVVNNINDAQLNIRKVMIAMVRYFFRSGGHVAGDEQEENVSNAIMNIEKWRSDRILSDNALRIFRRSGLLFGGRYTSPVPEEVIE